MGFSKQDYLCRLPFPSQGIFPTQGLNLGLLYCRQKLYHLSYLNPSKWLACSYHSIHSGLFLTPHFILFSFCHHTLRTSQMVLVVKNLSANAGNAIEVGWIPGLGRCPGEGSGNPLQYPCLENLIDRGAWWTIINGVPKSQTLSTQDSKQHHKLGVRSYPCSTHTPPGL